MLWVLFKYGTFIRCCHYDRSKRHLNAVRGEYVDGNCAAVLYIHYCADSLAAK